MQVFISRNDGGSTVRLVHTIDEQWKPYVDRARQAWASMLIAMDRLLVS